MFLFGQEKSGRYVTCSDEFLGDMPSRTYFYCNCHNDRSTLMWWLQIQTRSAEAQPTYLKHIN